MHRSGRVARTGAVVAVVFVAAGCGSTAGSPPPAGTTADPSTSAVAAPSMTASASPSSTPSVAPSPSAAGSGAIGACAGMPGLPGGRIVLDIEDGDTGRIVSVRPDGSDYRELVEADHANGGASWTPAGGIVFHSDRAGHVHLYEADEKGRGVRRLTSGDGDEGYPVVTPTGAAVLYDGNVASQPSGLWALDASTRERRRVTTTEAANGFDTTPDVSPDGTQVAFTRDLGLPPGDARSAILVAGLDGGDPRRLTEWELNAYHPSWSRDGRRIAFSSYADNNTPTLPADVWIIGADGSGLTQVTHEAAGGSAYEPGWSPTGDWLAFIANGALTIMSADGTQRCEAWRSPTGFLKDPDWGPG